MSVRMTRRGFAAIVAAGLATAPVAAFAFDEADARTLVQSLVDDINKVISSGKSQDGMIADFEAVYRDYADTSYVAAYAFGNEGRRASKAQKKAFSDAFNTYLARKYGKRFNEFAGGRLEVKGVTDRQRFFEVATLAYLPGHEPFDVTFQVSDRTGKEQFFNLFIEGVNMLLPERSEVGALLDRNKGDIDKMIADLEKLG